jgi:hypothetical protein
MRPIVLAGLLSSLLLVTAAHADAPGLGRKPVAKAGTHLLVRPAGDRQGGETIVDATLIPSLPYTDSGATCDNVDDYDEACPFTGSVAPDVVYRFEPAHDVAVVIDLIGSIYDTKVYVYDEDLNLIACNDDYYADYVSRLENVPLVGRFAYFVVVDGYGNDCGEYELTITEYVPCELMCPPGAMLEGEPPLADDYVDVHNGGCSSPEWGNPFQEIPGRSNGTQVFCGVSGWFESWGSLTRETDWFTVSLGPSGLLEIRGDAERPLYLFELGPPDCDQVGVVQNVVLGPCSENVMTIAGEPGSEVWIWTGPTVYYSPDGAYPYAVDYVLRFDGLAPADLTAVGGEELVAPRRLSTVKGLFR